MTYGYLSNGHELSTVHVIKKNGKEHREPRLNTPVVTLLAIDIAGSSSLLFNFDVNNSSTNL